MGVFTFFLFSGATSLTLEVVWTRMLGTVFGNTVLAASTVVTSFMLGLALGSVLLGRWATDVRGLWRSMADWKSGWGFTPFFFRTHHRQRLVLWLVFPRLRTRARPIE